MTPAEGRMVIGLNIDVFYPCRGPECLAWHPDEALDSSGGVVEAVLMPGQTFEGIVVDEPALLFDWGLSVRLKDVVDWKQARHTIAS